MIAVKMGLRYWEIVTVSLNSWCMLNLCTFSFCQRVHTETEQVRGLRRPEMHPSAKNNTYRFGKCSFLRPISHCLLIMTCKSTSSLIHTDKPVVRKA